MAHRSTDPTDEEIDGMLAAIPSERWAGLWHCVDQLREVTGTAFGLLQWVGGEQLGTTMVRGVETPVHEMHYPVYSEALNRLVRELYDLGLVTAFNWPEWDGTERYRQGRGLDGAPVADAVRMITAVVRSDRFSDGAIAAAVVDGTLPAALGRLRDRYGTPPTPSSTGPA